VAARRKSIAWLAAALLLPALAGNADAQQIDTIKDIVTRLHGCWKPPPPSRAGPMDITVMVSFNREGSILGRPRITYESEHASDNDRLQYRIAVMETLQSCTPLPFTEGLGGAVAGRRFAVRFWTRKTPPKPAERKAWLSPKIL
jgi:hypothetical protein